MRLFGALAALIAAVELAARPAAALAEARGAALTEERGPASSAPQPLGADAEGGGGMPAMSREEELAAFYAKEKARIEARENWRLVKPLAFFPLKQKQLPRRVHHSFSCAFPNYNLIFVASLDRRWWQRIPDEENPFRPQVIPIYDPTLKQSAQSLCITSRPKFYTAYVCDLPRSRPRTPLARSPDSRGRFVGFLCC